MTTIGQQVQLEVYGSAVAGKRINLPFSFDEWEARARARLTEEAYWYVAGVAGGGNTMRANREAFDRVRIRQRTLNDVSVRDISVELFGKRIAAPFLLAPIGVQGILHAEGERIPARAAAAAGIPIVLSSVSSVTMEEIAREMGPATRWFQLYPSHVKELTSSFVSRAEASGYSAIVVTVDTPALGWREQDLRLGYLPFLHGDGVANYFSDPVFRSMCAKPPNEDPAAAVRQFIDVFTHPAFSWADIAWLRSETKLPILIKGIIHPDDASKAADHGIDGIVVSNHGGRQADGALGTLDALPDVVKAANDRMTVLLDSGVRHGADVLKALALGAKAVLLGRPYVYALASHGEEGVTHLLRTFMADIDLQLGLCGHTSAAALDRSLLADF
ncbi:MAG TPA: alpha-hydroxy-acid oxidizing protein [Gemmatimonadaceae bacterium]|nr:alpha-hydroxy-acid oxidizing protein [Gemmatimonadaceae bacterium]